MRIPLLFGLAAALALPQAARAGAPTGLVYDRTLMSVAGARCGLFTPAVAAALKAGAAQARGAALRAGANSAEVSGAESRATGKALTVPCGSGDLALAAGRVRSAFGAFARTQRMNFAGAVADWRAERPLATRPGPHWLLAQFTRTAVGPVLFGLSGDARGQALTAATAWPDAMQASGARLLLRDPDKGLDPFIDPRRKDLPGRAPPRNLTIAYLAQSKTLAPHDLLPSKSAAGALFRFPPEAVAALERLDPRESVWLEVVYPLRGGERVQTAWFEVGDFAAGRAFLAASR